MHRFALALAALALTPALASAQGTTRGASPAQIEAQRQVQEDQREDRVAETARSLETGGAVAAPPVVDEMNRQRPSVSPGSIENRNVTTTTPAGTPLPLLGDNAQR